MLFKYVHEINKNQKELRCIHKKSSLYFLFEIELLMSAHVGHQQIYHFNWSFWVCITFCEKLYCHWGSTK